MRALDKDDIEVVQDTHQYLIRRAELLLALVVVAGPYEATTFFQAALVADWGYLLPVLALRYAALTPLLLVLIAYLRSTTPRSKGDNKKTAILLIALPSVALLVMASLAKDQAIVCPSLHVPPCCPLHLDARGLPRPPPCDQYDGQPPMAPLAAAAAAPPPPPLLPIGNASAGGGPAAPTYQLLCMAEIREGVPYCFTPPLDYLSLMGAVHAVFHYSVELGAVLRRHNLIISSLLASFAYLGVIAARLLTKFAFGDDGLADTRVSAAMWRVSWVLMWTCLAHLIGVLHYNARRLNLWRHRYLLVRQKRVLKNIDLETANCKELLKNVLPPHLIEPLMESRLPRLKQQQQRASGKSLGGSLRELTLPPPPVAPSPALVAESFDGCTFLFATVGGLSQLINDSKAEPRRVLRLLQTMYNQFDRLADTFQVQKVRKTANEYYLVAAGLPDPTMLPNPRDRAAAIAGYGFALLNVVPLIAIELERMGFRLANYHISVQIGLHSGGAIAGIIGHKTFQYDLCGDAVNTAARMCSTSAPGRVHVSAATYELLRNRFDAQPRGEREVKGKGIMATYFLHNAPPGAVTGMCVRRR